MEILRRSRKEPSTDSHSRLTSESLVLSLNCSVEVMNPSIRSRIGPDRSDRGAMISAAVAAVRSRLRPVSRSPVRADHRQRTLFRRFHPLFCEVRQVGAVLVITEVKAQSKRDPSPSQALDENAASTECGFT